MRLHELQDNNKEAKKLRSERQQLLEGPEDIEQVLYYQRLPYVLKVISFELISRQHDNSLTGYFRMEKIQ